MKKEVLDQNSLEAYKDCIRRAKNEADKQECEKLLTPEARELLKKERNRKDQSIKTCLKNADPNDKAAVMKCLEGLSDEEKLKYLEQAKRRAIKDCLMMANSDILV
ncbi:cag pathogenicity island protein Y VirB10-like protein [Helicobacter pylori Aklavik117]|nr:cag pathogenicity island protein Y VirB10-like protein [Helicobacter pylori Aklavik117]